MASPKPPNMETSCSELLFCRFSGDLYVSEKRYEVREIASLISKHSRHLDYIRVLCGFVFSKGFARSKL